MSQEEVVVDQILNKYKYVDFVCGTHNLDNILNIIKDRKNIENRAIVVKNEDVSNNDYNISVNSYLKTSTEGIAIDIKEVNKKIAEVVKRESEIR